MSHSTRFARETDRAAAVVVSRQPILDNVERIVGFELLTPPEAHPHEATASVLAQAIADIGLLRLVGTRPAHVDVSREFLLAVSPAAAGPRRASCSRSRPTSTSTTSCSTVLREVRNAGFRIALDGFRDGIGDEALLDLADSVKIDVRDRSDEDTIETASTLARGRGLDVIADGVQTRDVYGFCRGLGFDAFQGQYFAEPVDRPGRLRPDLPPARAVDARRRRRRRRSSSSSA